MKLINLLLILLFIVSCELIPGDGLPEGDGESGFLGQDVFELLVDADGGSNCQNGDEIENVKMVMNYETTEVNPEGITCEGDLVDLSGEMVYYGPHFLATKIHNLTSRIYLFAWKSNELNNPNMIQVNQVSEGRFFNDESDSNQQMTIAGCYKPNVDGILYNISKSEAGQLILQAVELDPIDPLAPPKYRNYPLTINDRDLDDDILYSFVTENDIIVHVNTHGDIIHSDGTVIAGSCNVEPGLLSHFTPGEVKNVDKDGTDDQGGFLNSK